MNGKEGSIQSVTKEFKSLILKVQKELKARDERFKKHKTIHEATKNNIKHFIRKTKN